MSTRNFSRPEPPRQRVDVIGDVHGCAEELEALLALLGYVRDPNGAWRAPAGRMAVFVGDLVDRGPKNMQCVRVAMQMVGEQQAAAVAGNHDVQFRRYLERRPVPLLWGLDVTVEEAERETPEFRREVRRFLRALPGQQVLDAGRLVVAHTGLPEALHGRESPATRQLAAFGYRHGQSDPGRARRHAWVRHYRGAAAVVHGHTPIRVAVWRNNTIDIDTGCVFGGQLTALRWPERELLSVPARRVYAAPPEGF